MKRRRLCSEDYTVGWICTVLIKLTAAEEMLDEEHRDILDHKCNGTNLYTLGRIHEHNVVIACLPVGQMGISGAATVAIQMKYEFTSIRFGLLVGIGGCVPTNEADIRLGDVVISQPEKQHGGVIQYDSGKATPGGFIQTGLLNAPPTILLNALQRLKVRHSRGQNRIAESLLRLNRLPQFKLENAGPDILFELTYDHHQGDACGLCSTDRQIKRHQRENQSIVVHYGSIASSNQVMRDGVTRDNLSSKLGGVLCFEMEAAGLMNNFPCLII
jgi:nucleoside phosphorylase